MSQIFKEQRDELLPPAEAAALLGLPISSFFAVVSAGRLPRPIKIGRRARWSRMALEIWIAEQHQAAQTK